MRRIDLKKVVLSVSVACVVASLGAADYVAKKKVLFDCDIGSDIDDSLALAYLLCEPQCELVGITTVSGEPHLRAAMASAICRNAGRTDIPIHVGIDRPFLHASKQPQAQQARKLANWPHDVFRNENTAVEFMRRTIRDNPGEITLLAVGPMSNVAALFASDPEIPSLLKEFVVMCGLFLRPGYSREWNGICDPVATALVYGAGPQTRPRFHCSYGLDVTLKVAMKADEARKAFASCKVLAPVADFVEVWFKQNANVCYHDPLAAVCLFHPEVCAYMDGQVTVPLSGEEAGWTVFNPEAAEKPHKVAHGVNVGRFFKIYFDTVKGLK